jgi:CRISPR-associated protein Cas6
MLYVDLSFAITGSQPLPADHGYALYAALSGLLPELHQENGVAVHPIAGRQIGDRRLSLQPWSRLTLRTRADQIPALLPLAGKQLTIAGLAIRIGVPQVRALEPRPALRSRLVTIKGFLDSAPFQAALRRQLDQLNISPETQITLGRRRTLRIKTKEVVGYEVLIEGLTAEESLTVQAHLGQRAPDGHTWQIAPAGLGGKRHMGCGVFVALKAGA